MKLYEEIAKIAHELYEKSGWMPGRDLDNWIEAEKIVKSRLDGGQSQKKSVEEPVKKAAPAGEKKASEPKKAPAKRTTPKKKKTV